MKDEKKATELYTIACKDDPKSPSCDKIGGTSKRLEFFVPKKSAFIVALSWQILILQKRSGKKAVLLANLEIQAPATGLLVSPRKKKLQKNKNLLAKKKMTAKLASR